MIIRNFAEVKKHLADIIVGFERQLNDYQTDVYGYLNNDGTIRLETFINVGGNSWKNDNHILVYSDYEHTDDMMSNLSNGCDGGSWTWLIDEMESLYDKTGIADEIINAYKNTSDYSGDSVVCIEDLDVTDVERYLVEHYLPEITEYYQNVFVQKNVIIVDIVDDALKEIEKNFGYVVLQGNKLVGDAENYDNACKLAEEFPGSTIAVWKNIAIMSARVAAM